MRTKTARISAAEWAEATGIAAPIVEVQDEGNDTVVFVNGLKIAKHLNQKGTATRRIPYPLDQKTYRRRNVIERMFCKLKNWPPKHHREVQW